MGEQHPRVAQDHLEVVPLGIAGRQVGVGQQPLGRAQDQRERRAQLVAHVGEELRLEAVELLGARVEDLELLVGLLQRASGVGDLAGPAHDLGLHRIEARVLERGSALALAHDPDEVGDVLHLVDDVRERAVGIEDRRVVGAPEALLEAPAHRLWPLHVVLLHGHGVVTELAPHAVERRLQVAHALGARIVGVVGEHFEDRLPDDVGAADKVAARIRVADGDDRQVGVQDEIAARGRLEERLEVGRRPHRRRARRRRGDRRRGVVRGQESVVARARATPSRESRLGFTVLLLFGPEPLRHATPLCGPRPPAVLRLPTQVRARKRTAPHRGGPAS